MNKQPLLHRNLILRLQRLARTLLHPTKHQLRLQTPLQRDLPLRTGLLVRQRVIMLQVTAEPFRFQRRPQHVLVHCRRVFGPDGEFVRVGREVGLQGFDGFRVFVEEDLYIKSCKSVSNDHVRRREFATPW